MKITRKENGRARIEMVPLIDVVFLLLVAFIFFAMSMTVYRGIPVDLPVSAASLVEGEDFLEITVKNDGMAYFNGEGVDLQGLRLRLARLHRASPEIRIVVAGDREAPYVSIISVIDVVKRAGITGLSLRTGFPDEEPDMVSRQTGRVRE